MANLNQESHCEKYSAMNIWNFILGNSENCEVVEIQTMFLNYTGFDKVDGSFYSLHGMGPVKLVVLLQFLG